VSRRFFKPVVTSQADFHAASPSESQLACQREAVIRPLAEADRLSCLQVDRAAKIFGLGRSVTYRLIARFRQRPQTSSLLLAKAGRPRSLRLARGACRRGCLPQLLGELGKTIPLPQVSGAVESTD
jgi:hypothetical protein